MTKEPKQPQLSFVGHLDELRTRLMISIAAVAAGEAFVVTRNGTPVAELRPITPGRRTFVPKAHLAALSAGSPHIDAAAFRRDVDRVLDQNL